MLRLLGLLYTSQWVVLVVGQGKEIYSTNAVCRPAYCINPIFPALEDLSLLESHKDYTCMDYTTHGSAMRFCGDVVDYDFGLRAGVVNVSAADGQAVTTFAYHLGGMGIDFWEHTEPWESADDCIKHVWRLSCYTYFPKCEAGVTPGGSTAYLRPCRSSCQNYVKHCGVECCDESVQCRFTHTKALPDGSLLQTQGYVDHAGPSSFCTGAARLSSLWSPLALIIALIIQLAAWSSGSPGAPPEETEKNDPRADHSEREEPPPDNLTEEPTGDGGGVTIVYEKGKRPAAAAAGGGARRSSAALILRFIISASLLTCVLSLEGRSMTSDITGQHTVGKWRQQPNYLLKYDFVDTDGRRVRNSCSLQTSIAPSLQCSGRGTCKQWQDAPSIAGGRTLQFCQCDREWADPECRTKRKSQALAYVLSLFFGFLGADLFYLGHPLIGSMKAVSLGGFGVWWIIDIIRVGSTPVYANNFRTAADLPHWAFVLSSVSTTFILGFILVGCSTLRYMRAKRKDAFLLAAEIEAAHHAECPPYSSTVAAPFVSASYRGRIGGAGGGPMHS
ncbi:unnamed protein product [Vitrella brassicaformis CCMP3155]|uniref:TM2 domain-containing protein n=2 Tax=Vitrella brassicaformis TaxID=1169539 RepID=A0A0G4H7K0_VITBC|nr:unnamed protein product [Vitrella brassicaformis CCMP3155]|eukprot:CEM39643.1 unnamed protein product [Vitrella brassicaformis CCMP3155]